ncbi:hypothetical protein Q7458_06135 [Glaesserella parasuis]|uniref:hypothetical protein n=1 Tax=Glaesserella parasuis TaxID=738 RepID=UPI0024363B9C|nr:hypothetical protein [Glaesserella parasuis]MDG6473001.1 hypothetical protein [Glaesserella parasuis]MDO9798978.1 hypothetical protein [Glaesserella parasuis]MDO9851123.1 hypothetical protein [Glaesserella parasuis]MDO9864294.1 hypothetical protein [Glaesserella parasuis]MDO9882244.1 hypothetical protein [Glaesserella parasuis]
MKKTALAVFLGSVLLAGSAIAHEAGSFIVRAGAFLLMQTLAQKQQHQLRLNYTRFFGAKALNPAITNLQVKKHSFGPVANAGIDIKLTEKVSLINQSNITIIK